MLGTFGSVEAIGSRERRSANGRGEMDVSVWVSCGVGLLGGRFEDGGGLILGAVFC